MNRHRCIDAAVVWTPAPDIPAGGTRGELERLCAGRLDLRFVTEDTTPNRKTVAPLLDRSDIAAIWTSTEISHKATAVLRGPKVLKVPRRGVAALADAIRKRCADAA
ncbi:MAG: hypothetical protein OXF89_18000 [Rhodospirillaceae bacterium]|nr:hypothetical protein [Rhodospirillaceae bacterium]